MTKAHIKTKCKFNFWKCKEIKNPSAILTEKRTKVIKSEINKGDIRAYTTQI